MVAEKKWFIFLLFISLMALLVFFKVKDYFGSENALYANLSGVELLNSKAQKEVLLNDVSKNQIGRLFVLWASWCEPCLRELPELALFYDEFKTKGIEVVLVNYDSNEFSKLHKKTTDYLVSIQAQNFRSLYDKDQILLEKMSLVSLPAMIVVNKKGKIIWLYKGLINWKNDSFRKKIYRQLLDSLRASFHHHFEEKAVT